MSVTKEDIHHMSMLIAKCAFASGQEYLVKKFSQDALKEQTKNQEQTAILKILDALSDFQ